MQRVKNFTTWVVALLGGGALLYLIVRYLLPALLPFIFGWGVAIAVRRPASFLHQKTRLPLGIARLLLAITVAAFLGLILFFSLRGVFLELSSLFGAFSQNEKEVIERIKEWLTGIPFFGERLATGSFLESGVSALLSALPPILSTLASVLPTFFFSLFVGVIAAIYFCLDLERIHKALLHLVPKGWQSLLRFLKDKALRAAFSVLRAQGILMLISFALMLVGFLLLGVRYPLLLSALFALLDILPILGVGLFLAPWGIWSLLMGRKALGIGLLVLFGVNTVVRQLAEPRILSASYGAHPLLILLSLYLGAELFGFVGLLLLPALTLFLSEIFFFPCEKKNK